ncbi:major capsid protein [Capybara microvirus Cap1_SP_244]|nr:major capsid protein [Capybara microvirus Cap1_SP_244]
MAEKAQKLVNTINKDKLLNDEPVVEISKTKVKKTFTKFTTSNIGDIIPVAVKEVVPGDTLYGCKTGFIKHMQTPIKPLFNAVYDDFYLCFVPHRQSADLLNGYKTRKSPFVKVFGEDPTGTDVIVPFENQMLPKINANHYQIIFDGISILDKLGVRGRDKKIVPGYNFLSLAAYELIYQSIFRNENRESVTNSSLYRKLFNLYNNVTPSLTLEDLQPHKANREKDYFTGSKPFTQKGEAPRINLSGDVSISPHVQGDASVVLETKGLSSAEARFSTTATLQNPHLINNANGNILPTISDESIQNIINELDIYGDMSTVSITAKQLRLLLKTQEMLEKDAIYGSKYQEQIFSSFGIKPYPLELDDPLLLSHDTVTNNFQMVFQTSQTSDEPAILGTVGANSTTQAVFELFKNGSYEFKEYGYLMVVATTRSQNAYSARHYHDRKDFKTSRFEFYTPELNDLGYQDILPCEFDKTGGVIGYNEAYAEYRYDWNIVDSELDPLNPDNLGYWSLAMANYDDIQSMYKQSTIELDRAVSITSAVSPNFVCAYKFEMILDRPIKLHSIPGFDGVI